MELNSYTQQSNHGIMDYINDHHGHEEEEEEDVNGSLSSSSEEEEEDDGSLCSASEEEFMADAASSSSSSFGSSSSSSSNGPLFEMSTLISELPFKRGLSKHFEGKSQSFTSLSNVKRLEDLIKHERPCKKKLKSSRSYGWGLDRSLLSTKTSSKVITKKSSTRGGSFSSIKNMKRHSFSRNWPSFPTQGFGGSRLETIGLRN